MTSLHQKSLGNTLDVVQKLLGVGFILMVLAVSAWFFLSVFDLQGARGNYGVVLSVIALIVGFASPRAAIMLFVFFLPVFGGNRPSMPQTVFFYQIFGALIFSLSLRWLHHLLASSQKTEVKTDSDAFLRHPVALTLMLFFLAGVFSLTSLDFSVLQAEWRQLGLNKALSFIALGESRSLYSFLTVLLQALCVLLFWIIVKSPVSWRLRPEGMMTALLSGLAASFLVGLLDYYHLVDLRGLRPLDPFVNPGDVQARFQSFFGHSGWYAQYLTLVIPSVLVVLTYPIRREWRIAIILGVLVLAEYVLILTYQRGGWVSYPLTVAVIWFCIYVLKPRKDGFVLVDAVKKSGLKILVSVPITIFLSLAVLTFVNSVAGPNLTAAQYVDRFKQITNTADRTRYIPVAFNLVSLYPVYGGGSESFAFRYVENYLTPGGVFENEEKTLDRYYGSAHSVYLQTLSGKGFAGLFFLVAFLASFVWVAFQSLRSSVSDAGHEESLVYNQRLIAMIGFSYAAAFSIYGNVQEIFYVPSLTVVTFVVAASVVKQVPAHFKNPKRVLRLSFGLAWSLFFAHLAWLVM